jgi:hypothetical protein
LMPLHNIIKKKNEVGRPKKKKCIKIKYYTVKNVLSPVLKNQYRRNDT